MAWMHPEWETTTPDEGRGVKVLRLCGNSDPKYKGDWPRVTVLDLSKEEFAEFDRNPLEFSRRHKLFPDQAVRWMTANAKPPEGEGLPRALPNSRYTAVYIHHSFSMSVTSSCYQEAELAEREESDDDDSE